MNVHINVYILQNIFTEAKEIEKRLRLYLRAKRNIYFEEKGCKDLYELSNKNQCSPVPRSALQHVRITVLIPSHSSNI